jgi:hypothetical protein
MKVKDLLTLLSQLPLEAEVVVKGYEGGVNDVVEVKLVEIKQNVNNEWYYGRHEIDKDGDTQAVFIVGEERKNEG